MRGNASVSCPKCHFEFDAEEAILASKYASRMAEKAMLEIDEKFRGFYKPVFGLSGVGNRQFICISCRVCNASVVAPIYRENIFHRWQRHWHYDSCVVDRVEKEEHERQEANV